VRARDGGVREELAAGMRACRLLGAPEMRPISEPIQRVLSDQLQAVFGSIHRTCLSALVKDRAMEAWYHPSIARMTPNRRVTWQATSDDENS
jgi:hypothetical protein